MRRNDFDARVYSTLYALNGAVGGGTKNETTKGYRRSDNRHNLFLLSRAFLVVLLKVCVK
jgi:hypothetical protein